MLPGVRQYHYIYCYLHITFGQCLKASSNLRTILRTVLNFLCRKRNLQLTSSAMLSYSFDFGLLMHSSFDWNSVPSSPSFLWHVKYPYLSVSCGHLIFWGVSLSLISINATLKVPYFVSMSMPMHPSPRSAAMFLVWCLKLIAIEWLNFKKNLHYES